MPATAAPSNVPTWESTGVLRRGLQPGRVRIRNTSGRGGIRTHGGLAASTIFKIVAINLTLPPFRGRTPSEILLVQACAVLAKLRLGPRRRAGWHRADGAVYTERRVVAGRVLVEADDA